MGKALQRGPGQLDAVIDAGVVEPVAENHIPRPHQRRDRSQVGHVAGGKNHRGFGALETGQSGFHRFVQGQVPHHQAGGPGPRPPPGRRRLGRLDNPGVLGQAQIIVGG